MADRPAMLAALRFRIARCAIRHRFHANKQRFMGPSSYRVVDTVPWPRKLSIEKCPLADASAVVRRIGHNNGFACFRCGLTPSSIAFVCTKECLHMKCVECAFFPCPNNGRWKRIGVPRQLDGMHVMVDVNTAPLSLTRELATSNRLLNIQIVPIFPPERASAILADAPLENCDLCVLSDMAISRGVLLPGEIGTVLHGDPRNVLVRGSTGEQCLYPRSKLRRPSRTDVVRNRMRLLGLPLTDYDRLAEEAPRDNWDNTALLHIGVRDTDFVVNATADDFKVALSFDVLRRTGHAMPRPSAMPPLGMIVLSAETPSVGLSITNLAEDSAAAAAGLQRGYVITAINGVSVRGLTSIMLSERVYAAILEDTELTISAHPSIQDHRSARFETRVVESPNLSTTSACSLLIRARELTEQMKKPCAIVMDAADADCVMAIVAHLDADPKLVPSSESSDDDLDVDNDEDFEWLCPLYYRDKANNTERVRVVAIRDGVTPPALATALKGVGVAIMTTISSTKLAEVIRKAVNLVD